MKSEMNIMNLIHNNRGPFKASPGPKADSKVDAHNAKTDSTPAQGGTARMESSNSRAERPAFKKIMKAVVMANKKAMVAKDGDPGMHARKTKEATKSPESTDQLDEQTLAAVGLLAGNAIKAVDEIDPQGVSLPESVSDVTGEGKLTEKLSDASSIIQDAIDKISKTLNLQRGLGLENLQIDHPTPAMIDQLAEILSALKGILALLENAVSSGESIDIGGKTLDVYQAASLEKMLRVEVFHIEIALSMVENGSEVAALIAKKSDQQADTGLIKAIDPKTITMPASQIKQVLGTAIGAGEQKIDTLVAKLVQMLRDYSASGKPVVIEGSYEKQIVNQEAIAAEVKVSGNGKKTPEVGEFDPQVMRMLLKIDKIETGNKEAALQNDKFDLPKIAGALFAKKPGEAASLQNDSLKSVLQGVLTGKEQTGALELLDNLKSGTIPRTIEESVITQLSNKLQTAIKTGVTEIRLLLKPESLGEMRVKLTIDGDLVMGKIYVENQQVKHIIEMNMQSLKDSLAQHNLQTGSFDVNVGGGSREQLNELKQQFFVTTDNTNEELSDASETTEMSAGSPIGSETGRRFGSNTIEYFA